MDIEANKALVRRYVEMWQTGNVALADEILAARYVDHTHPDQPPGPESVKQDVLAFRTAFSDVSIRIQQMVGEGDTIVFRFVLRGIHQGMFAGFAPTGKEAILIGVDVIRLTEGRMVELWSYQDTLSWVLQLDVMVSFPE